MGIFEDDDEDYGMDFMGRSPKSTYFETARTANQNIVEQELEKMLRRLAVAEKMLEERGLDEELDTQIRGLVIDKDIDGRVDSIFIELMGNIVTQCE
jgi:hypothetical protein